MAWFMKHSIEHIEYFMAYSSIHYSTAQWKCYRIFDKLLSLPQNEANTAQQSHVTNLDGWVQVVHRGDLKISKPFIAHALLYTELCTFIDILTSGPRTS